MWASLLTAMRNNGDNRQVEMIYTDLASNDFSTLFRMMQGFTGNKDLAYQVNLDNVFVHGCGTGFHRQLMADNSLNLGFSATAMHYVSAKPCEIEDHVHMVGASAAEQAAFRDQAAKDWEAILLGRAAELIRGGRFICYNFGIDEQGRFLGNTGGVHMFNTLRSTGARCGMMAREGVTLLRNIAGQPSASITGGWRNFSPPSKTKTALSAVPV